MSNLESHKETNIDYYSSLRSKRFEYRVNAQRHSLQKQLKNLTSQNCSLGFLESSGGNFAADESNPSPSTLCSLQILGLREKLFEYLSNNRGEEKYQRFSLENNEWIDVVAYSNGFSFLRSEVSDTCKFIRSEMKNLDTYKAIDDLINHSDSKFETFISDVKIDLDQEALFLLKILSDFNIGFTGIELIDEIKTLPVNEVNEKIKNYIFEKSLEYKKAIKTFIDGNEAYVFNTFRGYEFILLREGSKCSIGYSTNARGAYFEQPNQSVQNPSLPFIETPTAKELLTEFGRIGLSFNDEIEKIMIEAGESDRYGSVATHITREISKLINDRNRSLQDIFSVDDIITKIELIDESKIHDKTAVILVKLLKGLIHRQNNDDLTATDKYVSMKDGSCFDSAGYFEMARKYGDIELIKVNGKRILYKKNGAKTYMNLDSVIFNGVEIPPGGLFVKPENSSANEFALVRLTPYIDLESDPLYGAFAPEVTKALADRNVNARGEDKFKGGLTNFFQLYN